MATLLMFPGQGSQEVGMGKTMYDTDADVRALFQQANELTGVDLATLCFDGPMEALTETRVLQPAMTTVVLATLRAARAKGIQPDMVAGHSLGEYSALHAAGVISAEDCLKLVATRGALMQREAEANPGAMSAIMRAEPAAVESLVTELAQEHQICLANYNTPKQLVVSGSVEGIEALEARIKEIKGRARRLPVSGAWHSPLMNGAVAEYTELLDSVTFNDAQIPVFLNVTGKAEQNGAAIKAAMKQQMTSGVRWYPSIQAAWEAGARNFIEIGPKSVLTNMLKAIVPDPDAMTAQKTEDLEL